MPNNMQSKLCFRVSGSIREIFEENGSNLNLTGPYMALTPLRVPKGLMVNSDEVFNFRLHAPQDKTFKS